MDSKYAYIHVTGQINMEDETKDGELINLNYPLLLDEINLVSVQEYESFKKLFPDRIEGGIIKKDNLMNMINLLYDKLKKDIAELPEMDDYTLSRFETLRNEFEVDGVLKPDSDEESSINDLANKLFILQIEVRRIQREVAQVKHHK